MGTGSESRRARSSTRPGGSGGEDVVQEVPKVIVPLVLASLVMKSHSSGVKSSRYRCWT